MPHRINMDGISEKLFLLKNIAFASKSFCAYFTIDRMNDEDKAIGWSYYSGWLKTSVSEMLLEASIKFRVIQDFLKNEDFGGAEFKKLESKVIPGLVVGRVHPSLEVLPIREACNKIIHATEVQLTWIEITDNRASYEHWDGTVILEGEKNKQGWSCEIDVINFCIAIETLLAKLSTEIDWYHVYKYDE